MSNYEKPPKFTKWAKDLLDSGKYDDEWELMNNEGVEITDVFEDPDSY